MKARTMLTGLRAPSEKKCRSSVETTALITTWGTSRERDVDPVLLRERWPAPACRSSRTRTWSARGEPGWAAVSGILLTKEFVNLRIQGPIGVERINRQISGGVKSGDTGGSQQLIERFGGFKVAEIGGSRRHELKRPHPGQSIIGFTGQRILGGAAIEVPGNVVASIPEFQRGAELPIHENC